MKRIDFKTLMLRLNILASMGVLILLMPSVRIYSSWFPEKKESFWSLPLAVTGLSAGVWFVVSLFMPLLIKWGVVEDLRKDNRPTAPFLTRAGRVLVPILLSVLYTSAVVLICAAFIRFLHSDAFGSLFNRSK